MRLYDFYKILKIFIHLIYYVLSCWERIAQTLYIEDRDRIKFNQKEQDFFDPIDGFSTQFQFMCNLLQILILK